jgi:16S rRNA (cytosine1402-N4)-methyltransferase
MIHAIDLQCGAARVAKKRGVRVPRAEERGYHEPVLLGKAVELLAPSPEKLIVDGTLGGSGHTHALLEAGARVIGLDQDPDALQFAQVRLARFGERFEGVHANFAMLGDVLDRLGVREIDGGLLDLGVSSWQLDTPERGFSFLREGPLDMRMNPHAKVTAADIVNNASGEQLERIFRNFGEEPAARRIAAKIIRTRINRPIATTLDLASIVESVVPRRGKIHPATRVFQALRIAVNRELDVLSEGLEQFAARLRSGGRLVVITFHSLEDRIVKSFFKTHSEPRIDRPEWPAPRPNPQCIFKLLTRKAMIAGDEEQARNPRSRSAKLRAVEKI